MSPLSERLAAGYIIHTPHCAYGLCGVMRAFGAVQPLRGYVDVAVCVWWDLTKTRSWIMPVAVSETLNAPTGARNTVQAIGAVR